jgi:hypothetical protein
MLVKCRRSEETVSPVPPLTHFKPTVSPMLVHQPRPMPSMGHALPSTPGSLQFPLKYFFHLPAPDRKRQWRYRYQSAATASMRIEY